MKQKTPFIAHTVCNDPQQVGKIGSSDRAFVVPIKHLLRAIFDDLYRSNSR